MDKPRPKSSLRPIAALLCVCCGCIWLVAASLSPHLPNSNEPPQLYSNQVQQDLRLILAEAIRQGSQSIHLVMFGLSDPTILTALSQKTIPTTIYYDPTSSPNLYGLLPGCHLHPVHVSGLMHQKILVVDREMVFIGSANMTTASLTMHDNLVVGLKSEIISAFLIEKAARNSGYLCSTVGDQDVELWLLPDPGGQALQDLRHKIRSAEKSIQIALFTFTHPVLIDEILAAHARGIQIHVIVDLHSGLGASKQAIEKIERAGIKISKSQGIQLLHHKFMLIDQEILVMGSANWTKAAFRKNHDCILILHDLRPKQKAFMKRLWRRIEAESI